MIHDTPAAVARSAAIASSEAMELARSVLAIEPDLGALLPPGVTSSIIDARRSQPRDALRSA